MEQTAGGAGGAAAVAGGGGGGAAALTEAQRLVLERCIRALREARKDSQTLAALLLITRLCPAHDLDKDSLRRIFEAVGMSLPARLLVTAFRRCDGSGLSPLDVLSLGTALLSALSTDPDMVAHPQLLSTVPILLGLVANGPGDNAAVLDHAVAADCYQVLTAVGALPRGSDHLLRRGAVPALCRAAEQNQTLSREEGLPLLAGVLSGRTRDQAWRRHGADLLRLLLALCADFSRAPPDARLDMCSLLVCFLPPVVAESPELREAVVGVWGALRPMVQSRLPAERLGAVLVLGSCLLDLFGWQPVGPPNFCCLLVHRACVEVRVGLEGPPGTRIGPRLQHILAGCYRIMEAAFEQACCQRDAEPNASGPSLSLQQSRQVFKVLEEGFSAIVFHLRQVESGSFGRPFVLASYRCVCVWLAEETSCLKEEVTALLPFLLAFARRHLQGSSSSSSPPLADWMELLSVDEAEDSWSGQEALRYLLPALCHLTAEEGPRKVLLALDTPALLVDFLLLSCSCLEGPRAQRSPSMEALCSALLNFAVTEPDRVRTDPCFRVLEAHVSDTLPSLVTKPILLVLAANYCTLGLMMGSLSTPSPGPVEAGQRRLVSTALRFLRTALDGSGAPGPVQPSASWKDGWYEVAELWRLGLRALASWLRVRPGLAAVLREDGWLRHVLDLLLHCSAMQDPHSQDALEGVLCAAAQVCHACREELDQALRKETGALSGMDSLRKTLG